MVWRCKCSNTERYLSSLNGGFALLHKGGGGLFLTRCELLAVSTHGMCDFRLSHSSASSSTCFVVLIGRFKAEHSSWTLSVVPYTTSNATIGTTALSRSAAFQQELQVLSSIADRLFLRQRDHDPYAIGDPHGGRSVGRTRELADRSCVYSKLSREQTN